MKKVAISTLAVLIACPAFAGHPDNGSSWQMFGMDPYIGLRGGLTYENLNVNYNNRKNTMDDTVFQGRVALGLEVCDTIRSEVEWSIFGKGKDSDNFGAIRDVKVDTKLQTLMWNTYWEFSEYQIVRPFIGMGVGAAFTDIDRRVPGLPGHTASKTSVSAMGTLGVTFDMQRFAVDLAARYNYVDVQSGMHNFGGDIGIRFMF